MLFDDEEIQIMATARQPHLREPNRTENVSKAIYEDFLAQRNLMGSKVLELGPGQFDLVRMVTAAGASVVSIDHDPAVVALGKKRAYNVILADFRSFDWSSLRGEFDGLVCRGSISPIWFRDEEKFGAFADAVCSVLRPDGWGWILPWNSGLRNTDPERLQTVLRTEREVFVRNRFRAVAPTPQQISRYGTGLYPVLFVRD